MSEVAAKKPRFVSTAKSIAKFAAITVGAMAIPVFYGHMGAPREISGHMMAIAYLALILAIGEGFKKFPFTPGWRAYAFFCLMVQGGEIGNLLYPN